jgi:hypothetical protein
MGLCPDELRHLVIRPTLEYLNQYSLAAETLLMGTAAVESAMGYELKQNKGRGLGIYHITPRSHQLLWDQYLAKDPELASKVRGLASQHGFLIKPHCELTTNLRYATAIAWLLYERKGKSLPDPNDVIAMAKFWRRHFHSRPQNGIETYIERFKALKYQTDLAA